MKLSLLHTAQHQGPMRACILPGADATEWLAQMKGWQMPLSILECYLLPTSLQERKATAMLVVFQGNSSEWPTALHFPLRMEGERLLLPQNALLQPQLLPEELAQFSKWQYALMHPGLGFIGFEAADRVDFLQVILAPLPTGNAWDQALPPNTPASPLLSIQMEPMEMEEIWEEMKGEVGSKPLDEIAKKPAPEGGSGGFFGSLLGGLGDIAEGIKDALPQGKEGEKPGFFADALGKLKEWTDERRQELQNNSDSELERLMKMFEENPEEALKYAPPLNSDRFQRASQNADFRLGKNKVQYDSRKSYQGSGAAYHIDSQRLDFLKQRYQNAAQKALEEGNHDKAAYIYAQLLQDFHAAAGALIKGHRFREAALLYLNRLKLPLKAAECYAWAGDYVQAAEIYLEQKHWEQAADMFHFAGMQDKAFEYYDRQILQYIALNKYAEAANLAGEKLNDHERKLDIYLQGWQKSFSTQLLTPYLEAKLEDEQLCKDDFLLIFFEKHVPFRANAAFVTILVPQLDQWKEAGANAAILSIAYQMAQSGASAKRLDQMALMAKLIPEDSQLHQDLKWFSFPQKRAAEPQHQVILPFDPEFRWLGCCHAGEYQIAWGIRGKTLKFARIGQQQMQESIHPEDIEEWSSSFLVPPILPDDPALLFVNPPNTPVNAYFHQENGLGESLHIGSNHYLEANYPLLAAGWDHRANPIQILFIDENKLVAKTYDEQNDIEREVLLPFSCEPGTFSEAYAMPGQIMVFRDRHKVFQFMNDRHAYRQSMVFQFQAEIQAAAGWRRDTQHPVLAFATKTKLILLMMSDHEEKPRLIANHQIDQAFGAGDVHCMQFLSQNELVVIRDQEIRQISISGSSATSTITRSDFGKAVVGILSEYGESNFCLLLDSGQIMKV